MPTGRCSNRQWYSVVVSVDPATGTSRSTNVRCSPLHASTMPITAVMFFGGAGSGRSAAVHRRVPGKGRHGRPAFRRQDRRAGDAPGDSWPGGPRRTAGPRLDPTLAAQVIARWDFSKEMTSTAPSIWVSPPPWSHRQPALARHERLELDRRGAQLVAQAGALRRIHFHSDDLYDAGWETSSRSPFLPTLQKRALCAACAMRRERQLGDARGLPRLLRPSAARPQGAAEPAENPASSRRPAPTSPTPTTPSTSRPGRGAANGPDAAFRPFRPLHV